MALAALWLVSCPLSVLVPCRQALQQVQLISVSGKLNLTYTIELLVHCSHDVLKPEFTNTWTRMDADIQGSWRQQAAQRGTVKLLNVHQERFCKARAAAVGAAESGSRGN
jgi:hypothetical protein